MKLSNSNIKKFLIFQEMFQETETQRKFIMFSQKKAVLIFQKKETPKKFLMFKETENLKSFLYFRKRNFLIFRERYTQNPNILELEAYLKP